MEKEIEWDMNCTIVSCPCSKVALVPIHYEDKMGSILSRKDHQVPEEWKRPTFGINPLKTAFSENMHCLTQSHYSQLLEKEKEKFFRVEEFLNTQSNLIVH